MAIMNGIMVDKTVNLLRMIVTYYYNNDNYI